MGNSALKGYWPPTGMVTILLVGGRTEQYDRPVLAGDIMLRHPRHHVVRPDFFRSSPAMVIRAEEVLMPGHKFLLVPFHTVKKKLRRREERPRKSSSGPSDCHGATKDVNCTTCRTDCTKHSVAVGRKGATRIPASRLTVLKNSPAPSGSNRQARKALVRKDKLHSRNSRRRTPLHTHRRQKSADSEEAFEPSPDVRELALSEFTDYVDCDSFELSVVLPKQAAALEFLVPEYESFKSSAKSTINVESLFISVEERENLIDSKGRSPLEKLIFEDPAPYKATSYTGSYSGGVAGLGERGLGKRSGEKQQEKNSRGNVLPEPQQPASNGNASLAQRILQELVDSPKPARLALDGSAAVNGMVQKPVESPKPPRPTSNRIDSVNGLVQREMHSPKPPRPSLDRYASVNGRMQKEVYSPKPPQTALDRSAFVVGFNPRLNLNGVDSFKAARPASDRSPPVSGMTQKGVDSPKASHSRVVDQGAVLNGRMQKEADSAEAPRPGLSRSASLHAILMGNRVDSPKFAENGRPVEELVPKRADSPALDRSAAVNGMMRKEVDSRLDSPKPPRHAVDRSPFVIGLNLKAVDSSKAARPDSNRSASAEYVMQKGVDGPKAARLSAADKGGFINERIQNEMDSLQAPRPVPSKPASLQVMMETRVDSPKPAVNGRGSVQDMVQKRADSPGLSNSHKNPEDMNKLINAPWPAANSVKWAPLSEQLKFQIAAHAQPAITNTGGSKNLGQQPPSSGEKPLGSYLQERERTSSPPASRSESQHQKEKSEEKDGHMKELQLLSIGSVKGKIEALNNNGLALKSSAAPPPVDPKPVASVNQQSVTTLVKKQKPIPRMKLISQLGSQLCFAPQQGSLTPEVRPQTAATGDAQEMQNGENRLKLRDHLELDSSPPNKPPVLKQSAAATDANLLIQAYRLPIAQNGSARNDLLALQVSHAMKTHWLQSNNGDETLTTSIEQNFLRQPPMNYFRQQRIRTRRRVHTLANWKPRLSPLIEFSPTHSDLSVKS